MAVSFVLSKYLLFANLSTTYCPTVKIRIIMANSVISEPEDLMPPKEVAVPTIELSTIIATTMMIMTMKILLLPILIIDWRPRWT